MSDTLRATHGDTPNSVRHAAGIASAAIPGHKNNKDAAPTHAAQEKSRRRPKAKPAIEPSDIQGLKYFDKLKPLLARLHDVGTECDKAHNRDLHMDEYGILVLMRMFSPILTSMRALQQASELDKVLKNPGVGRTSFRSFSESVSVLDLEPLKQIAAKSRRKDELRLPPAHAVRDLSWHCQPRGRHRLKAQRRSR